MQRLLNRVLTAACIAAVLISGAGAAQENPFLKAKVGDWVLYRVTQKEPASIALELYEVGAVSETKVDISFSTFHDSWMVGRATWTVDLKSPYDPANAYRMPDLVIVSTTLQNGRETLKVGGKDYETTWIRSNLFIGKGDEEKVTLPQKVWFSKEIKLDGTLRGVSGTEKPEDQWEVREFIAQGAKDDYQPLPVNPYAAAKVGDFIVYNYWTGDEKTLERFEVVAKTDSETTVEQTTTKPNGESSKQPHVIKLTPTWDRLADIDGQKTKVEIRVIAKGKETLNTPRGPLEAEWFEFLKIYTPPETEPKPKDAAPADPNEPTVMGIRGKAWYSSAVPMDGTVRYEDPSPPPTGSMIKDFGRK